MLIDEKLPETRGKKGIRKGKKDFLISLLLWSDDLDSGPGAHLSERAPNIRFSSAENQFPS